MARLRQQLLARAYFADAQGRIRHWPRGAEPGRPHRYTAPARLRLNYWALSGDWTVEPGHVALDAADGTMTYRFQARDLNLVMGPAAQGASVRFRALLDGQPPGPAHGIDTDEQGLGTVTEQRLHQLIRQRGPVIERTFEITFLDAGLEAYSFTFG